MDLASFRKSRRISQRACAAALGFRGKSYISMLERGDRPMTVELALRIEKWSAGQVRASDILPPEKAALLPGAAPPGA